MNRDRKQEEGVNGLYLCSTHGYPGRTSAKKQGHKSHSGALSIDPRPLCTWKGGGHILTPSKLDYLPPHKGAEEHLKILFKDKVTVWGNGKTEEVKYSQ